MIEEISSDVIASCITLVARSAVQKIKPATQRLTSSLRLQIRRGLQNDYAQLRAMSRKRQTGFVAFLLFTLPPFWITIAMGDSAPYSLQLWVGTVMMFVLGATAWFATRDAIRLIRR